MSGYEEGHTNGLGGGQIHREYTVSLPTWLDKTKSTVFVENCRNVYDFNDLLQANGVSDRNSERLMDW